MQAVGRLGSYISQGVYTVSGPFHPFGGAVDIVVVQQPDGTFKSSPWYVRFGKFQGVLKAREKVVDICVNGMQAGFQMHLDSKGEAFFLREIDAQDSLFVSSGDDAHDHPRSLRSKSCNFDSNDGVGRTSSRRSRILGLVFGRRSLKQEHGGDGEVIGNRVDSFERAEIAANLLDLKWSTNISDQNGVDASSGDCNNDQFNQEPCFDVARDGECHLNGKEGVCDGAEGDVQVACVEMKLQARLQKQLNGEEVAAVNTEEAHGVCSQTSKSSELAVDCSGEQKAHQVMYHVHVHDEVLHRATVLLSEQDAKFRNPDGIDDSIQSRQRLPFDWRMGTETKEVTTNVDLGVPVLEVSEFHSQVQQMSFPDDSLYNEVDVEEKTASPKLQPVNMGLGHCSSEKVESNCISKHSTSRSLDDQLLDENNMKDIDIFSTISCPLDSLSDCSPRKTSRRSPSPSSGDENFFFSDLDESVINDRFERSFSPEEAEKEDYISYENGSEKFRVMFSPIAIPRNEAAGDEVGHHAGSLPNISSGSNGIVQRRLSQSLDSKSASSPWEFPGNDGLQCLKSDKDKENQLSHDEPGAKDCHDSGEFKGTILKLFHGNRICTSYLSTEFENDSCLQVIFLLIPVGCCMVSYERPQVFKLEDMNQVEEIHPGDPSTQNPSSHGNWRLWPFSLRRAGPRNPMLPPPPSNAKNTTFGNSPETTISTGMNKNELKPNIMKNKVRETAPTSEQLASLNLKEGMNTVTFTFSTAVLGKQQVDARIYLWKWNTRIVISDVDGTITRLYLEQLQRNIRTLVIVNVGHSGVSFHACFLVVKSAYELLNTYRSLTGPVEGKLYYYSLWSFQMTELGNLGWSDVLGQFMPLVGIDWSQTGVAHLFSAIKENGYQLLFLSARSISQAYLTRQFLLNLKQDGKVLPDGPVVISPDGLFPSLYREGNKRVPHEFKIACLEDIRALFPSDCNPFYAGFGNRDTDEISYLKVGIPKGKIFIINPRGEIVVNRRLDTKSYTSMHALVNGMFPPTNSSEQEDFNSWNFWKLPPPAIDI
ncbi:hypothetical protein VNO77_11250 [Canavalia gladiata]|uniref:LNS2/PITP domain-containing protein n=1 Tax=Canavalia gladiata TaxID=3824 RepID=A0AAN9MHW3_CANGL